MEMSKKTKITNKKVRENNALNNSIKFTLMRIIILFVLTTIIGFEIFSHNSVRNYYESSLIGSMKNQARINQLQYSNYMSRYDLSEIIIGDKNLFYRSNDSEVQILDNSGTVLYDSQASSVVGKKLNTTDVIEAMDSKQSFIKYENESTKEEVLSLSYPLISNNNQIGILRLTSSLDKVNKRVKDDMFWYVIFGIIIFLISIIVSIFAANSFVKPINELTKVSEKLALGDYKIRAQVKGNNEISKLAKTLNTLTDNIVKREDMKNEFISSVSHELRTPLTSIKGWAITLQSPEIQKDTDMTSQGLSIIESEGDRLSMMVEDLLDFSRISSTTFKYDKQKLDIVALVKQIHTQLIPRCQSEDIEFNFTTIYKSIPVFADKNRLKEVFINIIDNAIKFTGALGKIDILIDQKGDMVSISIIDNGEGIKEDEIEFVASKFYKGSSSKSQTGLGLSICEEIIKAHDGALIIKSKYTLGTTVTVEIPRLEDEKES